MLIAIHIDNRYRNELSCNIQNLKTYRIKL